MDDSSLGLIGTMVGGCGELRLMDVDWRLDCGNCCLLDSFVVILDECGVLGRQSDFSLADRNGALLGDRGLIDC